ncbi:MAG: ABC transporter [Deltaproteobacteria bacterium]|jgi:ATP-binding cassette subfamily F protein uup|nr:ABC transporter [Deltaproteobacteria bacterium]
MSVIDGRDLCKSYGARTILAHCRLTIGSAERVGLVGNNGSGKSTLGRILAGSLAPDSGTLAMRRGARIDYLPQEPTFPEGRSIRDVVLESLRAWSEAHRRHRDATRAIESGGTELERAVAEQARAAEELERLGGWERLHEAEAIVDHLGLDDPSRPVETLSGGERRRLALARVLVDAPDLAILDEPTNHLDIGTIEWLEDFLLSRFRGALLLITHDRSILDRVTSRTFELHAGLLTSYAGGYASYLEAKAERTAQAQRTERNRQNFLRRELEWLRGQPKARGTKQKARIARAHQALDQKAPEKEKRADLRTRAERQGKQVLELVGLRLERAGQLLIESLDLALTPGQRVGVIGPNGTGKTSLLLAILGELEPSSGEVVRGRNTRIGHLDQARSGLDDAVTVREAVAGDRSEVESAGESLRVGAYLERFLFDAGAARVRVGELSGGERARVCLAKLLCQSTNLLLLDEPTNDLDVSTLGALEAMLLDYRGSALVVSHDRWFLDRIATSILSFEGDGRVELHPGHYSDYRERTASRGEREAEAEPGTTPAPASENAAPRSRPQKLGYLEQREIEGLIDQIDEAEREASRIEAQLADPAIYQGEREALTQLQQALEAARRRVTTLTSRWEELEAKREALSN